MIRTLGDPHLGKKFVEGVPLHRRGQREEMQWSVFEESLHNVQPGDVHVCMGDLFDGFSVDEATVLRAARVYKDSAQAMPTVFYYILRGNHDAVRDSTKNSSFDVFKELVAGVPNILVVSSRAASTSDGLAFFPWHPFLDAKSIVEQIGSAEIAFGHWDTKHYGADNPNLLPFDALKKIGVKTIYTGHEHRAFEVQTDGVKLICTGSMLPYAHGEGDMFITVTLEELEVIAPETLKSKCVRVLLRPGEELPEIDCLQLTAKRVEGARST